LIATLVVGAITGCDAWDPWGMAPTPPMGWANWNGFACNYDDSTIRAQADALVSTGMRDVGYNVVIIQECITKAGSRDKTTGAPQPDPVKFPHGMKSLVDYIHTKGLRAGIYTDVGPLTCAGYEGSFGHEEIDALTYAQWGIDFIEDDACNLPEYHTYPELYARMRDGIIKAHVATGHPMMLYMCSSSSVSQENVHEWGPVTGTLWRTTGDIASPGVGSWERMMSNFKGDTRFPNATSPGAWQDPDMLIVGMLGVSPREWAAHFSMWAMAAAPLWAGVDLTTLQPGALEVFMNSEVIAVDQDKRGVMALPLQDRGFSVEGAGKSIPVQVWHKALTRPEHCTQAPIVLLVLNTESLTNSGVVRIDLSVVPGLDTQLPGLSVRDLWLHKDVTDRVLSDKTLVIPSLPPHGVTMLKVFQRNATQESVILL